MLIAASAPLIIFAAFSYIPRHATRCYASLLLPYAATIFHYVAADAADTLDYAALRHMPRYADYCHITVALPHAEMAIAVTF